MLWSIAVAQTLFGSLVGGVRLMSSDGGDKQPQPLRVTLIEGQDIGTVVCAAARKIFKAAHIPVAWDYQTLNMQQEPKTNRMPVSPEVLSSAAEMGLVLCAGQNELQQSLGSLTLNKALNAFVAVRKFIARIPKL